MPCESMPLKSALINTLAAKVASAPGQPIFRNTERANSNKVS